MFVNDDWKKILKLNSKNEALSKKFINKDIDIFAENYGYGMSWGETNKTQCSYGGVTLVTIISTIMIRIYLVIYGLTDIKQK